MALWAGFLLLVGPASLVHAADDAPAAESKSAAAPKQDPLVIEANEILESIQRSELEYRRLRTVIDGTEEAEDKAVIAPGGDIAWVISLNGLAVLWLGILPGWLWALCVSVMNAG